jgi:hypothetical protein
LTIREIADEAGISTGSAHSIVTEDLHMCTVVEKFVSKLLSQEQQELYLEVVRDMLEFANGDPEFLKTVNTGDETWVHGYDLEMKVQLLQWKHSSFLRPKEAQWVRSKVKVLLIVFFDYRRIVNHSYAPEGHTINKEYYLEVIRHLCDAVRSKRPDLWASRNWQLHHDNAPAHSSHLINSFLAKHGIPVVRQAPYSPDMAPCDFWFFPQIEETTEGFPFRQPRGLHAERNEGSEMPSRNASSSGRNDGPSVWSHKGPTLKGIRN